MFFFNSLCYLSSYEKKAGWALTQLWQSTGQDDHHPRLLQLLHSTLPLPPLMTREGSCSCRSLTVLFGAAATTSPGEWRSHHSASSQGGRKKEWSPGCSSAQSETPPPWMERKEEDRPLAFQRAAQTEQEMKVLIALITTGKIKPFSGKIYV